MLEATWQVMQSLAPWLLIGAVVTGAIHAFLPKGFIRRALTGRRGVVAAVAMGVPLPLCSCGVIPAGLGLKEDGASDGATVGFMISTPQTGVDSIMVSAAFLGWPFALFKVFSAAVTGLIGGWIADAVSTREPPALDPNAEGERPGMGAGVGHAVEVLRNIWRWLVFGVLASAAITVWLPASSLDAVADWGPLGAGVAVLVVSLPLYVCATASVPIAAALVAGGLPPGAALVFLMAGPASNVATVGAIYRGLGGRMLLVYLVTLMVGSLALGLLFDGVLGEAAVAAAHDHLDGGGALPAICAVFLTAVMGWFALGELRGWLRDRGGADAATPELTLEVAGMTCGGCTGRLERLLNAQGEIDRVAVQLEPGQASIQGTLGEDAFRQLIKEAGFEPGLRI